MSPAITKLADARRSVAITGAPLRLELPLDTAEFASNAISAPIRCNSGTCMKRFSKMVSVITPVPSATQFKVTNCACISVGNAGCGAVLTRTACGLRPSMSSSIQSSPVVILAPACSNLSSTASNVSGAA